MKVDRISLGHGSGGSLMHKLIKELFLKHLKSPILKELTDAAALKDRVVFSTDSYVVKPLFFPGGDIGKLAVFGTVNDLAMMGAEALGLSCAMIIEEGFDCHSLEKITRSLAKAAKQAGVAVVTGDVKVVEKGGADGLFINTSGIGKSFFGVELSARRLRAGDKLIINGFIGEHGIAVLSERKEYDFNFALSSDCAALNNLVLPILKRFKKNIKFMRDPTRGGLATTLNELTESSGLGVELEEERIPVSSKVKSACEILGLDPLYIANEGKVVLVVAEALADRVLKAIRQHPLGRGAQIIGSIIKEPRPRVYLKTQVGGRRIVDMLTSDPLPRIC